MPPSMIACADCALIHADGAFSRANKLHGRIGALLRDKASAMRQNGKRVNFKKRMI